MKHRIHTLGLFGLLLASTRVTAAVPVGVPTEGLLFYSSFNSQSAKADVAGGKPDSLSFTRTLQYFQAPGVVQAGFQTQANETCKYAMEGNFDPRQGTVGFWVRTENWTPADRRAYVFFAAEIPGVYRMLVQKPASDTGIVFSVELLRDGKRVLVSSPVTWSVRSWHKVDAAWDGQGISLFLDGVAAGRAAVPQGTSLPTATSDGFINVNPNNYFAGKDSRPEDITTVDEITVHGRPLSVSEIAAEYGECRKLFFPSRRNPSITVPFDPSPVTLDGKLGSQEWSKASRVPLQNLNGKPAFSGRQAWVLLKHDDKGLCLGFHASGDTAPVANIKTRDGWVWEDGGFEAVFETGPDNRIQLAINSLNVVFDMKNNDSVWNGVTQTAAGRDDDGWSAEVVLPYTVLGVPPVSPGVSWHGNFMYDWDQRKGGYATWSPFILKTEGFFGHPATFGTLAFAGEQEGIRILSLGQLTTGLADARVAASSRDKLTGVSVRLHVGSDQGSVREVTAPLTKDDVTCQTTIPKGSEGILALTATAQDGRVLAVYDQSFEVKPPVQLATKYLPHTGMLEVSLDFANLDSSSLELLHAGKLPVVVELRNADGKAVLTTTASPKESPATVSLAFPKTTPPGPYRLCASLPIGAGTHVEEMALVVPPFDPFTAKAGIGHDVPDPWKPIAIAGDTLRVVDREYRIADSPFPAQMTSLGAPLLKKPFTLTLSTASGQEQFVWSPRKGGDKFPDAVSFSGTGSSAKAGVTATWKATAEFDGLWVTNLTLQPTGKPVTVNSLTLEFDLDRASAEHVLALLRKPWEGDTVRLDLFHNIDSVPNRESPFGGFWLTGMKTGLYWFTTTDANWVVTPKEPNVFITRRSDRVSVKITIITQPVTLERAASYEFGVCATPARPQPLKNYGSGDHEYIFQAGKWQNWTSLVNLQPDVLRTSVDAKKKQGFRYMYQYSFPGIIDEDPYYGFWNPVWKGCPETEGLQDLIAYRVDNLARDFGVGPYFDMNGATWCDNADHGCAYTDAFGKKTKTMSILGLRELLKRSYIAAHAHGCKVWNHNHSMFLPAAHVFSDIWFPGEQYTTDIVGDNHFYSRSVKLEDYRVEMNPRLHGMIMLFLPEVARAYDLAGYKDFEKWYKPETGWYTEQLLAMILPHNMDCSGAYMYGEPIKRIYEIYKAEGVVRRDTATGPSAQFTGYWENPAVKSDDPKVMVSYYTFPGQKKLVVIAGNPTLKPATIRLTLDRKRLGLQGPLSVRDAYRDTDVPGWEQGVEIPAENFAILVMQPGIANQKAGSLPVQPQPAAAVPVVPQEHTKLLANPGFEEVEEVNVDKNYADILTRGGDMPTGEAVAMPKVWGPNPGDGWIAGQKGVFRFVAGEPGKGVHSGKRAIFLACRAHAAFAGGGNLRVQDEALPDQPSLSLTKPNRFSVWAKGSGKLMVYAYTYDRKRGNIYGKVKSTPTEFALSDSWQKYEGVLEFVSPEVGYCVFVVSVDGGEVTVDDVEILAQ